MTYWGKYLPTTSETKDKLLIKIGKATIRKFTHKERSRIGWHIIAQTTRYGCKYFTDINPFNSPR